MLILLLGSAFATPCVTPTVASDVTAATADAVAAYANLDGASMSAAIQRSELGIACLSEPMTPQQLREYYFVYALNTYYLSHAAAPNDEVLQWMRAARALGAINTQYGDEHPFSIAYQSTLLSLKTIGVPRPLDGEILVDGTSGDVAPTDRPWLFQRLNKEGTVAQTVVVQVGHEMPPYSRHVADELPVQPRSKPTTRSPRGASGIGVALLATGAVTSAAGGGIWANGNGLITEHCYGTQGDFWCPGDFYQQEVAPKHEIGAALAGTGTAFLTAGIVAFLVNNKQKKARSQQRRR